jgi:ABC-type multidrug transport system fused ATPase/permease subunit
MVQVHGVTAVLDNDIRTLQAAVTDKLPASVGHIIRFGHAISSVFCRSAIYRVFVIPLSPYASVLACLGFIFAISWKLTIVMIALAPVAAFAQVASSRVRTSHANNASSS